jgi:hypothetical protein
MAREVGSVQSLKGDRDGREEEARGRGKEEVDGDRDGEREITERTWSNSITIPS